MSTSTSIRSPRALRATRAAGLGLSAFAAAFALGSACAQAPASAWSMQSGDLSLEAGLDTYSAYYAMQGTWWNLAAASAPTFDNHRSFAELWVRPKLSGRYQASAGVEAYGALAVGATQTLGADAFDYKNQGTVRVDSALLGLRMRSGDWLYDVSLGRQPFVLGTGMLLAAGSSNGYSWGGGASAQRKVWGKSLVARASVSEFSGTAFLLEPDEAPEARTDTQVQGLAFEWARPKVGKAGLAWLTVPRSQAPYPGDAAPLVFIEEGRKGLSTWHGWADVTGFLPEVPQLGLRAEFADQRNDITRVNGRRDPMKAGAWLLGASWWGQTLPFAPKFSYQIARFSGDKPGTRTYERFDPLFWGNGLDNWWLGANGAYSWLNSNLRMKRFILDAYLSPRDIVQIQHVSASADQVNSPVQFGQGVTFREGGLQVGVPTPKLSSEIYVQYSRVFSPTLVATAFVARTSPSSGLKATIAQDPQVWMTFGIGLTANF